VDKEISVRLGLRQARQAVKSMEFMRRNLERVAAHIPRDRHIRDIYRQLLYDSSLIYDYLHDELELASSNLCALGIM
jgi:hypothetical protein